MLKQLLTLAAGTLFSLDASAGYVQYNFTTGDLSGFIIQHDDDKSIALYDISGPGLRFFASGIFSNVSAQGTYFSGAGPTNGTYFSHLSDLYYETLKIGFSYGPESGLYAYYGVYNAVQEISIPGQPPFPPKFRSVTGLVTAAAVAPGMAAYLDSVGGYADGIPHAIPTRVPEPASLALFAVGALGAAGAVRRCKTAA